MQVKQDAFTLFRSKVVGEDHESYEAEVTKFIDELYEKTKVSNVNKSR